MELSEDAQISKLDEPDFIEPICLPDENEEREEGSYCMLSGMYLCI